MSFYTSLSGLQAAQTDLAVISHNLANVSTNGFKRSRSEFADVISSAAAQKPTSAIGSGVVVKANRQQFSQGNLVQSQSGLDLAISGDGFFAVKPTLGDATVNYTRNGAFLVDADRYVVDGQGGHLQIFPADGSGAIATPNAASAVSLRLPATNGEPVPTGNVSLAVNLPSGEPLPTSATFDRFDADSYNYSTQTTIYDAQGNAQTLTNYFRRDTVGTPASPTSSWSVFSFVGDLPLTTGGAAARTLTFDGAGVLTAPTGPASFDPFTAPGTPNSQVVSLNLAAGTTQKSLSFDLTSASQDGAAVGQLQGVTVDGKGIVKASFSNGETQVLGQVALANFANPAGLRQLGNSYWAPTGLSGSVQTGQPGGNGFGDLLSGTIERSNVDITEELVNLIAAQRNFQANAKALETDRQVSQTIFNIQ